jgi:hypothetical protein
MFHPDYSKYYQKVCVPTNRSLEHIVNHLDRSQQVKTYYLVLSKVPSCLTYNRELLEEPISKQKFTKEYDYSLNSDYIKQLKLKLKRES